VLFTALAVPMVLMPGPILLFFLRDPALVEIGRLPLQLVGVGVLVDGLGLVMMHALLGAGATGLVMKVSVAFQWLLFLPAAYLLGPVLGMGLAAVWIGMTAYRALQSGVFVAAWERRHWATLRV
jgi:MATE family multidrug resistance protein